MDNQMIPNLIIKRATLTPNRVAIRFERQNYTYKELYELAYRKAGYLQKLGVEKGDYVACLLKSHLDTIVILVSLQLIGGVAVLLNNRLTADELMWQLNDSKADLLITEREFVEKISVVASQLDKLTIVWKETIDAIPFEEPAILEEIELQAVCTVMYTSGTTGNPKGVLQTYGNHWWSATGSALNLGIQEEDSWLCAVPLFHISGYSILMRSLIYGMKLVLHDSFQPDEVIKAIKDEKVTIMSVVTTMMTRLLDALGEEKLPTTFRCMLLGGGPAPLSVLEQCVERNIPIYQTYGMTETSSQIVTLAPEYSIEKLGSAGKPLFPSQLKIIAADGSEVGAYQSGEIIVKGPNVTRGYLHREHEHEKYFLDGWFKTGDIGYLDKDGFLFVQDRRSDLIISGGENIYPAEIEGVITSHPQIEDAGVIGIADPKWGQVPVAFVLTKADLTEEEVKEYCKGKVANYKLPKKIYFVEQIPRNASRKLLRRALREML
ncbi:o-succinylbenzoate--CoA ligase [Robertmurraya sp. DFI.2.37]|uniref:o-succinylbenzoate--CoA ligase n=1 Tax=Robertmurraya sp. DFI.2.37 TaxID=3031819 RepID=UPI001246D5C7|nr:o-succinylbenzoate--CoA ligase [Robertmurraya sp. DFI.2.37]MDF1509366.1 o-succinylbenzoate--CoA ligase [Robertmurraya sp. DFI.2.37]